MDAKDLENRFVYHNANPEKTQKMENIRKNFRALADLLNEMCPDGREKSLAITSLEQAQFWANASIVRNE
jgi:hypothetical protein